ncbi:DUF5304 family protein [Streptomyces avicenniae]|uniref:DUF5304 family protein n=1 Tax=Streptomyces avicenniae TaxID=500153 RepID=UPI000A5FCA8A|nr:DUF5304 family protein [Streptomyces avicenniae]
MSDSTPGRDHEAGGQRDEPRPEDAEAPEADAWARAAEEDLAAERERRRARYGPPPPGSAADELRKLADAVTDRLAGLGLGLATGPLAAQARAAIEPVIERNAEAFQHLANAGQELLAAYRAAALSQEQRWTRTGDAPRERADTERADTDRADTDRADDGRADDGVHLGKRGDRPGPDRGEGDEDGDNGDQGGPQRIDLD